MPCRYRDRSGEAEAAAGPRARLQRPAVRGEPFPQPVEPCARRTGSEGHRGSSPGGMTAHPRRAVAVADRDRDASVLVVARSGTAARRCAG